MFLISGWEKPPQPPGNGSLLTCVRRVVRLLMYPCYDGITVPAWSMEVCIPVNTWLQFPVSLGGGVCLYICDSWQYSKHKWSWKCWPIYCYRNDTGRSPLGSTSHRLIYGQIVSYLSEHHEALCCVSFAYSMSQKYSIMATLQGVQREGIHYMRFLSRPLGTGW